MGQSRQQIDRREALERAVRYIHERARRRMYGSVEVHIEDGRVVRVQVRETLRPDDLD